MYDPKLGPHDAIVKLIGNTFGSGDEAARDILGALESAGYEIAKVKGGCYINGCETEAQYRAEGFPLGPRVDVCRDHIAQAANYFTTHNRPLLVLPLRLT